MSHLDLHLQFALDRSHRLERAATEHRAITEADAVTYAAPELRVPEPLSSSPVLLRESAAA